MPKESVYSSVEGEHKYLTVAWGRREADRRGIEHDDHELVAARKASVVVGLHALYAKLGEPECPEAAHHAQLTRQNINDLIRTLRRARDQAYGRDE